MQAPKLIKLFPTLLQRTQIAAHSSIAATLLPEVERIRSEVPNGPPENWACPVYSTYRSDALLHTRPAFHAISEVVRTELQAFAEHKAVAREWAEQLFIDRCWLTIIGAGQSLDLHNQPNSLYTAIYFLQVPPDSTRFTLHNPSNERGMSLPVQKESPLNQEHFFCRPSAGDVLVLESQVLQSFMVHQPDEEHVTLTFASLGPLATPSE